MGYTPNFTPTYENGWEDLPLETTPITADALNNYDDGIEHIEDYLASDESQSNIADAYDETATYSVGDYVIFEGNLYKCTTAVTVAEEFDSDKWTQVVVTDEMGQGGGGSSTLAGLTDVNITTPTDGQVLTYDADNDEWINGADGGGGNTNMWTGTQAEYETQASQIADGTLVNITDDEEHTQAFEIYSTDEQVIGTYLGKTLYRKVIPITSTINANANTWTSIGVPIGDIATIVNGRIQLGITDTYSLHFVQFGVVNGYLNINSFRQFTINANSGYIILEYTKTTD